MNETVWFLSAVINGRFSVTSIIADNPNDAIKQAQEYLMHTALIPLSDITTRPMAVAGPGMSEQDIVTITSDCFVASLIKS